ncbi:hypothetical protein E2C01_099217 [Portunus trituberculatus]|uniref:Uncharacterized protein n=1 Tax=Portunus trituberculatus TaxID=210409 RepID=A0A5B7K9S0_PORTR|nr:hypothetical protein [Portunus trituberculatus]
MEFLTPCCKGYHEFLIYSPSASSLAHKRLIHQQKPSPNHALLHLDTPFHHPSRPQHPTRHPASNKPPQGHR